MTDVFENYLSCFIGFKDDRLLIKVPMGLIAEDKTYHLSYDPIKDTLLIFQEGVEPLAVTSVRFDEVTRDEEEGIITFALARNKLPPDLRSGSWFPYRTRLKQLRLSVCAQDVYEVPLDGALACNFEDLFPYILLLSSLIFVFAAFATI